MEVNNLKKYVAINLIGNCIYSTIFVLFICGNEVFMNPWWVTLLAAIVPSVLTCLVTLYISRKSQINNNTEAMNNLDQQIKSNSKKVFEDIGKTPNDKTLTGQHKDLRKALDKEINLIEQRYAEEEKRLMQFSSEQQNTAQAINDFKLFMASWTKTTHENNDLKIQISSLKQQLELLNQKVNELEKQNQILKYQSHHKSDNQRSHDEMEL